MSLWKGDSRTGGTRGGGPLPIVSGGELRDKKIKIERAMGPPILMASVERRDATTNRKSAVSLRYIRERQRTGQRRLGMTWSHLFSHRIMGQKNK